VYNQLVEIPLGDIIILKTFNCRGTVQPQDCYSLASSMEMLGLQEPIILRAGDPDEVVPEGSWVLVSGFRRYTAAQINRWDTLSSIIRDMTKEEAVLINVIENIEREDLGLREEVAAVGRLIAIKKTHDEVCKHLKKSSRWTSMRLSLMQAPEEIQELAFSNEIPRSALYNLFNFPEGKRVKFMEEAIAYAKQGYSGRVGELLNTLKKKKVSKRAAKRKPTNMQVKQLYKMLEDNKIGPGIHYIILEWVLGNLNVKGVMEGMKEFYPKLKGKQRDLLGGVWK